MSEQSESAISLITPNGMLEYGLWMSGGLALFGAYQLQAGDQSGGVPLVGGFGLFAVLYGFRSALKAEAREARDSRD